MTKILFVCHGNICRSPMAQSVFVQLARTSGAADRFTVDSAATSREELGNPIDSRAAAILRQKGISVIPHCARLLRREEYAAWDHIIAMDRRNLSNLPFSDPEGRVSLLLDWTEHPGSVADPWYTGNFEEAYADVLRGCTALLKRLTR